jgi:ATP-dependent helicase HrpA
MALLKLWMFYHGQARHLSRSKLRKLCREYFLSAARMREWHDIHQQLQALVKATGMQINQAEADYAAIHRALLSGLLSNVAFKSDAHEFTGPRNLKLAVFPGSGLFARPPKWIVAAELVETARRYARTVAKIEPQWIETLAEHLVKRHHSDPHWEKRAGQVVAYEKVTLYGLVLVARRRVNFGPIDPGRARDLFIRGALVHGELTTRAAFLAHNQALLAELQQIEEKTRRRDVGVDEELLYGFYDERIPAHIHSAADLERWYQQAARASPRLLFLARQDLSPHAVSGCRTTGFPDELEIAGIRLGLEYRFAPGDEQDGVTAVVPLALLNQLSPQVFEWLVPGLVQEKVTALIRSLPKRLRRHFVPAPDYARACLEACPAHSGSLLDALTQQLERSTGVEVPADAWSLEQLPAHLRMRFRVVDAQGGTVAAGRDLAALKQQVGARAARQFRHLSAHALERDDVKGWDFGDLPAYVELKQQGLSMRGYPALVVDGSRVGLRILDDPRRAGREHRDGLVALFRLVASGTVRHLEKHLPGIETMCLKFAGVGSCEVLRDDLVRGIIAHLFPGDALDIRARKDFEARALSAERQLMGVANDLCGWVGQALAEYHEVARQLGKSISPRWLGLVADVRTQLAGLVYPGFVTATPFDQLPHLARYIRGIRVRLQRAEQDPGRDQRQRARLAPFQDRLEQLLGQHTLVAGLGKRIMDYRWLVEEFRISLFAQELGTARPVSPERLQKLWSELGDEAARARQARM